MPQSIMIFFSKNLLPAVKSFVHFPTMPSDVMVIRQTPLPARAIPSHIAVEVVEPMPSVKTRNAVSDEDVATALSTSLTQPSMS